MIIIIRTLCIKAINFYNRQTKYKNKYLTFPKKIFNKKKVNTSDIGLIFINSWIKICDSILSIVLDGSLIIRPK
ncbi:hypothetical protein Hanom_Chr06g00549551 [Helianthus anomalus]